MANDIRTVVSLIHGGLISGYTVGLAVFVKMNSLDKFFVKGGYCSQFRFYRIGKLQANTLLELRQ